MSDVSARMMAAEPNDGSAAKRSSRSTVPTPTPTPASSGECEIALCAALGAASGGASEAEIEDAADGAVLTARAERYRYALAQIASRSDCEYARRVADEALYVAGKAEGEDR